MNDWNPIENALQLQFQNYELIRLAFLHPSYAKQLGEPDTDNTGLQYLGEQVLKLAVLDYLCEYCPYLSVANWQGLQGKFLEWERLTKLWLELGLGDRYPFLDAKLEDQRYQLRTKKNNPFSEAFYSLLGAIYLDRGHGQTQKWLQKNLIDPLLKKHLKSVKTRNEPEKQVKLLGNALLDLVVTDYLYHLLPNVPVKVLKKMHQSLTKTSQAKGYLGQVTDGDHQWASSTDLKIAPTSFKAFFGGFYWAHRQQQIKGSLRKTKEWLALNYFSDHEDDIWKEAIELLLKEKKPQKWIIRQVMGYSSKDYNEGRDRYLEILGETEAIDAAP